MATTFDSKNSRATAYNSGLVTLEIFMRTQRGTPKKRSPVWMKYKSYAELKKWCSRRLIEAPEERLAILTRMTELRYGIDASTFRFDRKNPHIEVMTMEEFRRKRELEDEEDVRKYGPR